MSHHHDYPIEVIFDWHPTQIDIPLDWTPHQAETAVTILSQIEERIWSLFGEDILNMNKTERIYPSNQNDTATTPTLDDDLPF